MKIITLNYGVVILAILLCPILSAQNDAIERAKLLIDKNHIEEALSLLEKNASEMAIDTQFYLTRGKAFLKMQEFEKAIQDFNKCIELDPSNAECYYRKGVAYLDRLNYTENYYKKGIYAYDARSSLANAIELQPSHVNARIKLANYYMNAPLIAGGSMSKAEQQAREVIKYDSNLGNQLLASIYIKDEEFDQAEKVYLNMLKQSNPPQKGYYWLSNLYTLKKDYENAFRYCKQSIKIHPDYMMGYYQYAKIASLASADIDLGIKHCKYYLTQEQEEGLPGKHWAYYRLAMLQKMQGNEVASKQSLENALNIKPDFQKAKDMLASFE